MTAKQEPAATRTGMLALAGAGFVALTLAAAAIAWVLVRAPAAAPASRPSVLEHGLIERAEGGEALRAAGAARLTSSGWLDHDAHLAHVPIDRAIDAVVANPGLIGGTR